MPPSVESLSIDFAKIPIKPSATKAGDNIDPGYTNDLSPITDVIYDIWQHIYNSIIDIPVNCFEAVVSVQPVENGKGEWLWETTVTNAFHTYTVSLIGVEKGKKVNWELQVSRDGLGGFRNYTWITGWSYKDGSAGAWDISVGPHDTSVMITAEWAAVNHDVQSVKLTYNLDHKCGMISEFFNGSYVELLHNASDPAYDCTLIFHYNQNIINLNIDAVIEWNSTTGNCRVTCNKVYSDANWHSWR